MAVDKKSDHVGNHGGAYTDMDGMSRQFTYIDHDKKPKIASGKLGEGELEEIKKEIKTYKQSLIESILALPASMCPWEFETYTIRNENTPNILWNEAMLKDEGTPTERLRELRNLIENKFGLTD